MEFREFLHTLRVWDTDLPPFTPDTAPPTPLPLFQQWLTHAATAGQPEPHTMSLATVDTEGNPDIRTLTLHDADDAGWHFGSHSTSAKGRQLAAHPVAALGFYWPVVGRQVRVRGHVTPSDPAVSQADLHARSTGALAAALVGRMSEVLADYAELEAAYADAWQRAEADPLTPVATWTRYVLDPTEVEFFQGDAQRRHVRLRYRREGSAWTRELLWP
ncbi:Pyridoxine/pyridoxamine 5'-phosphate oxidase [Streptomyces hundungensis]|uniref:Pyridoxine/pyridoxamine 5'-phosphate oxidase n=1 Tax=Streptomyces hundungensis TaxID=1077946 RepID=A0A387HHR6_9ACTN|nr:pyridoxal 5'-phosphate synthase [Streptomyces hundungensis]AYG82221.1 Pyridoxine/pyridoxamine 5'-phosphate oxidase [Streptomyces hundungensis]